MDHKSKMHTILKVCGFFLSKIITIIACILKARSCHSWFIVGQGVVHYTRPVNSVKMSNNEIISEHRSPRASPTCL